MRRLTNSDIAKILADPSFFPKLRARANDVGRPQDTEQNRAAATIVGQKLVVGQARGRRRQTVEQTKLDGLIRDYIATYAPRL